MKILKIQIEQVLDKFPVTRNSDRLLLVKVLQCFYGCVDSIPFDRLNEVPNFESVRRLRQLIQHDGQFLPTTEEVALRRRLNIDAWRKSIGYFVFEDAGQGKLFG